jgi:glycosyltransferase involved in cell wall biosynthesis
MTMRVSVCLASYNGSQFIQPQIASILAELDKNDELIVVDDCSQDDTYQIIEQINDNRISLSRNATNVGVIKTFSCAIEKAQNDVIFLSDQDDIWVKGRKARMLCLFEESSVNVIATNYSLIDYEGNQIAGTLESELCEEDDLRWKRNITKIFLGKMNYYGCAMAFRTSFRNKFLPFPLGLQSHDIWIALIGNLEQSIRHSSQRTLMHRIHGNNASIIKRKMIVKINARIYLLFHSFLAISRLVKSNLRNRFQFMPID